MLDNLEVEKVWHQVPIEGISVCKLFVLLSFHCKLIGFVLCCGCEKVAHRPVNKYGCITDFKLLYVKISYCLNRHQVLH